MNDDTRIPVCEAKIWLDPSTPRVTVEFVDRDGVINVLDVSDISVSWTTRGVTNE